MTASPINPTLGRAAAHRARQSRVPLGSPRLFSLALLDVPNIAFACRDSRELWTDQALSQIFLREREGELMAMLVKADGTVSVIQPARKYFSGRELHKLVGGLLEVIPLRAGRYGPVTVNEGDTMWINEGGKRLKLPSNMTATAMLKMAGGWSGDVVMGDVVICANTEVK